MADKQEAEFLIEPPLFGETRFEVGVAEGAKPSREFCDALERVMKLLQTPSAGGNTPCPSLVACDPPFSCGLDRCKRVFKGPCAVFVSCTIEDP